MQEIWRNIVGFEGKYAVSNLGNIKTLERPCENKRRNLKEGLLSPRMNRSGYLQVLLYNKGYRKTVTVHKLVADAFIDNSLNKPQINHIDGNKKNNHVNNLEWTTAKENTSHAHLLGLCSLRIGKNNSASKYVEQLALSGSLIKIWESMREAGKALKVSQSSICQCCKGKVLSVGGFKWRYAK
jgi:hypothetical protein